MTYELPCRSDLSKFLVSYHCSQRSDSGHRVVHQEIPFLVFLVNLTLLSASLSEVAYFIVLMLIAYLLKDLGEARQRKPKMAIPGHEARDSCEYTGQT